MKDNKSYRLLKSLSRKEFKKLLVQVESPVWRMPPLIQSLLALTAERYPDFDYSEKGKREIYAELCPGQKYDDRKLRRYFSKMYKILQESLVFTQVKNDTWVRGFLLIKIYKERGLLNLAKAKIAGLHAEAEKNTLRNDVYWLRKIKLYDIEKELGGDMTRIMQKRDEAVNYYFICSDMRHRLLLQSRRRIFKETGTEPGTAVLRELYQTVDLSEEVLFQLLTLALEITADRAEPQVFTEYAKIFFDTEEQLSKADRMLFFYTGLNYCVRQTNRGNMQFYSETLAWYKLGLQKDIMLHNGSISGITFGNIVINGLTCEEYAWVSQFTSEYGKYLPKSIRRKELKFTAAIIDFYQKNYTETVEKLTKADFNQRNFYRNKTLLIRSYFELFLHNRAYYSGLSAQLLSFESLLYRDKTRTQRAKNPSFNFCKILKSLAKRINNGKPPAEIRTWLYLQLEKYPNTPAADWIKTLVR